MAQKKVENKKEKVEKGISANVKSDTKVVKSAQKKSPTKKTASTKSASVEKKSATASKKKSSKKVAQSNVQKKVATKSTGKKSSTVVVPKEKPVSNISKDKIDSSKKTASKAKEKAIKKSQQANKTTVKVKEDSIEKGKKSQSKKKIDSKNKNVNKKKTTKKKETKAVYISPSQLEKQDKRKFPWEVCMIVLLLGLFIVSGVYSELKKDNGSVSRSNSYDILNSIILDSTDIVSVGSSNFKHSKWNDYINGASKAKIFRMDQYGKVIFEKVYNSKKSSSFHSVVSVTDGYIVVGNVTNDKDDSNKNQLGLIVKYDKEGNIVWEKTYESSYNTEFYKVISFSDGYFVVGSSLKQVDSDIDNEGGALLFKYDLDGNLVWKQFYGDKEKARFNSLVIVDQNIFVVGRNNLDTGVILNYSLDGLLSSNVEYNYTDDYGLTDIAYKNGSLYVIGSKKILPNSDEENELRNTTNTDAVFLKYNTSFELQFEKVFGGSNQERYNALIIYGKYAYVVGSSNSMDSGLKIFTDGKKKTGILIKYDLDGDIERKGTYGGSNNDMITDIVTDNSNLYITCFTNSKDGNILTEFDNGKDSFGKVVKVDARLRTLFIK